MTGMQDPVDLPLGGGREANEEARRKSAGMGRLALGGLAVVGMAAFVAVVAMTEPSAPGGRPIAVATIETKPPPAPPVLAAAPAQPAAPAGPARAMTAADYEAASGVRVHRPPGTTASSALIIEVPQAPERSAPGLALAHAPDQRLIEKGRHGTLPRIGADGARASEVYARPVLTGGGLGLGAPRLAIYVGGVGLSQDTTRSAIALPPAVTLALAPYGESVGRDAAAARAAGHEILLQAPMEPNDYPANNPGRNTLLASDPAENIDRLHWLMSRFPGYVGVTNYLGGRFLADESAARPVLREIGQRGLFYVEDVASERGVARIAASLGAVGLSVDVVIDRAGRQAEVEAALDRLEKLARERGSAIGAASALPATIEALRKWSAGLEARGIALVPLSAMAVSAPAPSARNETPQRPAPRR